MRRALYHAVGGESSRLSAAAILPISQQLDLLLNRYHAEKCKEAGKRFG